MKWAWPSNQTIVAFAHVSHVTLSMSIVPNQKQWLNQLRIPDLPDSPNQPASYNFPKKLFGKKTVVELLIGLRQICQHNCILLLFKHKSPLTYAN